MSEDIYKDENWLLEKYHEEKMTMSEMSQLADCSRATIYYWMKKHDIESRSRSEAGSLASGPPKVYTTDHGYERTQPLHDGEAKILYIHRLAAVAWFGFENVKDKQVHHKNGIPWDNREDNIEPINESEHKLHHYKKGDYEIRGNVNV